MTHSPRISKVDLVDPNEYNGDPTSSFSSRSLPFRGSIGTIETSDNDVRNTHADGTSDEDGLATKLINVKNSRDGGEHEQDTTDTTSQERGGVASQTQVLEDESGVVQDSVDTRPCASKSVRKTQHNEQCGLTLLEDHGENSDKDSLAERLVSEQGGVVVESKLEVVREASGLVLRELRS